MTLPGLNVTLQLGGQPVNVPAETPQLLGPGAGPYGGTVIYRRNHA